MKVKKFGNVFVNMDAVAAVNDHIHLGSNSVEIVFGQGGKMVLYGEKADAVRAYFEALVVNKEDPESGLEKVRLKEGWFVRLPDGSLVELSEYRSAQAIGGDVVDKHIGSGDG